MTQHNLLENEYTFDVSKVNGDILTSAENDPYYNKSPQAQQARVDAYIQGAVDICTKLTRGHYGEVHNTASFSDIKLLNLDREFKIQLFKRLTETSIDGSLIKVAFPSAECDYDVTLSW